MEELLNGLMQKVGLEKDKAEKVLTFLKENAGKVVSWIGGESRGIAGKLGDMLPGTK